MEAFDKTNIWIDQQTALHRMNTWGKGQRPFLFLTDYLHRRWLVEYLDRLSPDKLLFAFPGYDNLEGATASTDRFTWHPHSLAPDLYQKNMSSAGLLSENQNTFTIDGRVGYDLKDSLYVVYMADTAEELDKVGDNDYVATMPVVNKRFSFSVQLDKPKVGRIRTVMPDGSLCELWTNLDFVPGETYRITTHNGYYDEDRDYEQRVGRYSGKSLLNGLQRRGIDDQTFTVVDEVPEEFRTAENNVNQGGISTLSVSQNAVLVAMAELVKLHIDKVKNSYQMMGAAMKDNFRSRERVQLIFKQILQQNKELDKQYQEFIKYIRYTGAFSSREWSDMYKEILKFYTEQNQGLSEAYKDSITNGRPILKLRDYLNKQTEKYMKEMSKVMTEN